MELISRKMVSTWRFGGRRQQSNATQHKIGKQQQQRNELCRQCKARNAKGVVEGMAKHRKGSVGRVKLARGDGN